MNVNNAPREPLVRAIQEYVAIKKSSDVSYIGLFHCPSGLGSQPEPRKGRTLRDELELEDGTPLRAQQPLRPQLRDDCAGSPSVSRTKCTGTYGCECRDCQPVPDPRPLWMSPLAAVVLTAIAWGVLKLMGW